MVRHLLPEERPKSGDLKVVEEVGYEVILEWFDDEVGVNLYVAPHSDYQEIVADDPHECEFCDGSGSPSVVSDLPARFQRQFDDVVRVVENEYGLSEESGERVCTMCFPIRGGTLQFMTFLR